MINSNEMIKNIGVFSLGLIAGIIITFFIVLLLPTVYTNYTRSSRPLSIQAAREKYCGVLMHNSRGCSAGFDTNSIQITDFDANKDGKIDIADTLQALCENWYGIEMGNQTACKEWCGCYFG